MWIIISKSGDMVNTDNLVAVRYITGGDQIGFASDHQSIWTDKLKDARATMNAIRTNIAQGEITYDLTDEFAE